MIAPRPLLQLSHRRALLPALTLVSLVVAGGMLLAVPGTPNRIVRGNQRLALTTTEKADLQATISASLLPSTTHVQFSDPGLGLAFSYAPKAGGTTWSTKTEGTRVYLIDDRHPDARVRFVERFPKAPEDSLATAIEKAVLPGFDPANCPITVLSATDAEGTQRARLNYDRKNLPPDRFVPYDPSTCPAAYTPINWLAYFETTAARPDVLLFVSVGQDSVPAALTGDFAGRSWYTTISLQ